MADQEVKNKSDKKKKDNPLGIIPKPSTPKFNFNFYWLYGLVIIVILAINFMDWGNQPHLSNWQEFETKFLKSGDVDHVEVVNKERVFVYIKKDKLNKEEYKTIRNKTFGDAINEGPHYYFTIGDVGTFEKKMAEAS